MEKTLILAFYKFHPISSEILETKQLELEKRGEELGIKGLAIIGVEGLNATLCGEPETLKSFVKEAATSLGLPLDFSPKESWADMPPFRRMKVKIREEIVTLGKPEVQPLPPGSEFHLSPDAWDKAMAEDDVLLIDTRNWYETKIGKFKGALDPNIEEFIEFSDYLKKSEIPKDKKVLIYCTGGIRCEKAIVEMHQQGFNNVYQLDGGILNYLEQRPNKNFEGECFVFDHRVAVDQTLRPSQTYKLCPHCGQPGATQLQCRKCECDATVCEECVQAEHLQTCSKNCAHHYQRDRESKGRQQAQGYRFDVAKQRPATNSHNE